MPSEFRLCACGCGQPVKRHSSRWATRGCVPRSLRSEGAKKGRREGAYKRRALMFRVDLEQLPERLTREDLLALMMKVYQRANHAGFQRGWKSAVGRSQERGAA